MKALSLLKMRGKDNSINAGVGRLRRFYADVVWLRIRMISMIYFFEFWEMKADVVRLRIRMISMILYFEFFVRRCRRDMDLIAKDLLMTGR
ncbi:hypothetical protein [Chitinophaga polysaccharea]|uniref:hypothetical protein n=1 Tax=Chitinophaga polysaccharea TaxID=1293035 RepID=UPI00115B59ED|nr:hypothetical protein [Chitinophaga polysaccharea]